MWDLFKVYIYLCLFVLLSSCKQKTQISIVKVEDFFSNPQKSSFHISPDGKNLSYLQPFHGKLNIFVQSLERNDVVQITTSLDQSIKYYFWAGNHKLFYLKNIDGSSDHYQLYSVNKDGTQTRKLETSLQTRIDVIDQVNKNEDFLLIAMNERVPEYFDVYKLDINTGERTLLVKNPGNIIKWISDNDGNILLAVGSDGLNETLYYRENKNAEFKPIFSNNFRSTLDPLGFTGEKNHIYALSNINRDKLALVDFDCVKGKEVKVIYENPNADILDVMYSKSSNKLSYLTYEISKRELFFLDDRIKAMYDDVRIQLPGQEVKILDRDQSESNFLIKTYTDKDPGSYYLYHIKNKELVKLADLNPNIKVEDMCEMKSVSYKSRDGLIIHGYLTIPKGKKANNLPCVIIPHQGPSSRNVWGYSPEVQFLANRGYAVFQMNYRGSTGYGKAFKIAGFKQWGKSIQDDITDGVNWLISEEIADPKKIAVYGYSFGGYSALNQVIYHPELYKCAASYSGFINLFTYIKGLPAYYKPYQQMLNEMIGNPELDVEYLKYGSPIFQTEKIKIPLLVIQGGKDSRVNVNETNQFVKELRKNNVNVEYILNDSEGHSIQDPENKKTFYKNLEAFLSKNLRPDK
jgi:dipeptidyl aminopeptidase/acylaminoacyl peptidase